MDDESIVRMFWARDEQAIPSTADKYGKYCISIAQNILGNKEDAEECVNDAYLQAWNSIPPHRPNVLSTFLGRLVRNLSINKYRHNIVKKRGGGQATVVLEEISELISDGESIENLLERRELLKSIEDFLDKLPENKRRIFVCRYWFFESVTEISNRFGITENSVSVTLNRLRKKLHKHLLERGFDL
ncbi:MAG: sigma-70 family RNA polymerase sigma factor [Ruminococcaceae bacterium]|nr:sigma-70 family RNA polymerase sigma factor [Oscillospiraceae bacterium]